MADVIDIEDANKEHRQLALVLTPEPTEVASQAVTDDIAHEYRLYFDERAQGGSILYGRYDRGWVCNPGARWVMSEMARLLLEGNRFMVCVAGNQVMKIVLDDVQEALKVIEFVNSSNGEYSASPVSLTTLPPTHKNFKEWDMKRN